MSKLNFRSLKYCIIQNLRNIYWCSMEHPCTYYLERILDSLDGTLPSVCWKGGWMGHQVLRSKGGWVDDQILCLKEGWVGTKFCVRREDGWTPNALIEGKVGEPPRALFDRRLDVLPNVEPEKVLLYITKITFTFLFKKNIMSNHNFLRHRNVYIIFTFI